MNSATIPVDRSRLLRDKLDRHIADGEREAALDTYDRLISNADDAQERSLWESRKGAFERGERPKSAQEPPRRPSVDTPKPPPPPPAAKEPAAPRATLRERWGKLRESHPDRALCLAEVLILREEADAAVVAFQTAHDRPTAPNRPLAEEDWALLRHPDEAPDMTNLMGVLGVALRGWFSQELSVWGVKRSRDLVPLDAPYIVTRSLDLAATTFGLAPRPDLYAVEKDLALRNACVDPPAILIGRSLLHSLSARESLFLTGKLVCSMLPAYYVSAAGYPAEFVGLLAGVARHRGSSEADVFAEFGDHGVEVAKALSRLPPALSEVVWDAVDGVEHFDVGRWATAVELTADRAGLLMCGSLLAAVDELRAEPEDAGVEARVKELTRFAVSPQYFALRERLGLAVS